MIRRIRAWLHARKERRVARRRAWRDLSTGREEPGQQREDWR